MTRGAKRDPQKSAAALAAKFADRVVEGWAEYNGHTPERPNAPDYWFKLREGWEHPNDPGSRTIVETSIKDATATLRHVARVR